nr:MAG TPA: hypothetical protein [Caudoviricetes sp.]
MLNKPPLRRRDPYRYTTPLLRLPATLNIKFIEECANILRITTKRT